jgi:hypothetical protein
VQVENNYLAMFIRNWSARGVLNRFSRIILAPQNRTPGRININTAETRFVAGFVAGEVFIFNPLLGIPGILLDGPTAVIPANEDIALTNPPPPPLPIPDQPTDFVDRARMVVTERTEWEDGRYYLHPSDLVVPFDSVYPNILSTSVGADARFDELAWRYSRMANLITTRSDVFEILVTAQTGYLSSHDENGDGRIDFRNDFVIRGEKKSRTIYER